jgi:hypothetical protein
MVLLLCGKADVSLRLLRSAMQSNYCLAQVLQHDPLAAHLRANPQYPTLLAEAKQCQDRFLAERDRLPK